MEPTADYREAGAEKPDSLFDAHPATLTLPVLWGHMDPTGRMNPAWLFRFFESVRVAYGGDEVGMFATLHETGIGPILAETEASFLHLVRYPDRLLLGCRTIRLTETTMTQSYLAYSLTQNRTAATGTARIVAYDYRKGRKSAFPHSVIRRILAAEKGLCVSMDQ